MHARCTANGVKSDSFTCPPIYSGKDPAVADLWSLLPLSFWPGGPATGGCMATRDFKLQVKDYEGFVCEAAKCVRPGTRTRVVDDPAILA